MPLSAPPHCRTGAAASARRHHRRAGHCPGQRDVSSGAPGVHQLRMHPKAACCLRGALPCLGDGARGACRRACRARDAAPTWLSPIRALRLRLTAPPQSTCRRHAQLCCKLPAERVPLRPELHQHVGGHVRLWSWLHLRRHWHQPPHNRDHGAWHDDQHGDGGAANPMPRDAHADQRWGAAALRSDCCLFCAALCRQPRAQPACAMSHPFPISIASRHHRRLQHKHRYTHLYCE